MKTKITFQQDSKVILRFMTGFVASFQCCPRDCFSEVFNVKLLV